MWDDSMPFNGTRRFFRNDYSLIMIIASKKGIYPFY